MKAANGFPQWLRATGAYVAGGALSSVVVGTLLGAAGALVLPIASAVSTSLLIVVLALGFLRDTGMIRLPIVEACRQTQPRFGTRFYSLLWGFDIGLFFTTHITLLAVWSLPLAVLFSAQPTTGAALFLAYWIGRAAPAFIVGPLLLRSADRTVQLLVTVSNQGQQLRTVHAAAIAAAALLIVLR